ncbi:MAG: hypothetical protein ABEJ44_01450 [Halanaeroarchaeum sp.]
MDPNDPRYDQWPVADNEEATFVGAVSGQGTTMPIYYDKSEGVFFGAEIDEEYEQFRRLPDQEWVEDPTESLGEAIERLGEELGWESLSEFAESHLEDDDG